ncbi:MAG TPA: hypothetical protein VK543_02780 [Puia sp.]|nr:hypothetical protein [Puia sp.]
MTLQLLKFYEKIFQFWHQGYECFVSNKTLMEYAGMKSDSTVREAFIYFESHGEMKRTNKDGQRFIIPPQPKVIIENDPVDKSSKNSSNDVQTSAVALGGERCGAGGGSAVALDNNINIIKQNNKSFCRTDEQKKTNKQKHSWADKPKSPFADVTKQSTSAHTSERDYKPADVKIVESIMMSLPQGLRPKKYRNLGEQNVVT